MTRPSENLATYLKRICNGVVSDAVRRDQGDVEAAIAQVVSARIRCLDVLARVRRASPHEQAAAAMIPAFVAELQEVGAPPAPPPADSPLSIEHVAGRIEAATPEAMRGLMSAAAQGTLNAADRALRDSTSQGWETPSQTELAAWMGTDGAEAARAKAADRLAALWGMAPGTVNVTGWVFGGLVGKRDGAEYHAPAAEVLEQCEASKTPNPLAALVRGWRPRLVAVRDREKPAVLPASLAMVNEGHKRAHLFGLAAHVDRHGEGVLPGFEAVRAGRTPSFALALYDLGVGPAETPGRGAPLAQRLWVESILAASLEDRGAGPVLLEVPLRDLLAWLYPHGAPKPHRYLPRLEAAIDAINTFRYPWRDPRTGRGGKWSAVLVQNLPTSPDDVVRLVVDLPPGSNRGPRVTDTLRRWGVTSAAAYRGLLNLAYDWHHPGRTGFFGRDGYWRRIYTPDAYEPLSDGDLADLFFPASTRKHRRLLVHEAKAMLERLAREGELQVVDLAPRERRILPPHRPRVTTTTRRGPRGNVEGA